MMAVILGVTAAGLYLIGRLDRAIEPVPGTMVGILAAGMAGSLLLRWVLEPGDFFTRLVLALMLGCLVLASVTDVAIRQVYNFVWWIGGAASAVLLWKRLWSMGDIRMSGNILFGLLFFWMIQLGVFGRLYGKADCYAFCVCALAEAGLGMELLQVMVHMAFAFGLLVSVQLVRKNITLRGNLKKPVPFLPYITAAFYLVLLFEKICEKFCFETVVSLS